MVILKLKGNNWKKKKFTMSHTEKFGEKSSIKMPYDPLNYKTASSNLF